jgi:hypothetical protein
MLRTLFTILILMIAVACNTPPDINRTRIAATNNTQIVEVTVEFATNTPPPQVGEVTPTQVTTPTPFVFPVAVPATPVCPEAPRTRLIIQERGRVMDDDPRALRMRSGPGTGNDIIDQLPINSVFLVLEGPVCGEDYAWWRVRHRNKEGWIAEGEPNYYYVEPYLPG